MSKLYARNMSWTVLRDLLKNGEEFHNSTRNFRGVRDDIASMTFGRMSRESIETLRMLNDTPNGVNYVIYSYATPIACRIGEQWVIFSERYSKTTVRHQSVVQVAISEMTDEYVVV